MADLFKIATKKKYRFNYKGQLTVEDLWDLSVQELDKIYKNLKGQQKAALEESLLNTATKEDKILLNKIEIIKTIVNDKQAAMQKQMERMAQKAQKQRILEIMADKQDAELKEKSIEELQAMLTTSDNDEDDE